MENSTISSNGDKLLSFLDEKIYNGMKEWFKQFKKK